MKKSSKLALIISISAVVVAIALIAGAVFTVTNFFRGSSNNAADYGATVRMLESANKNFVAGEVAKVGPYDVTVSTQKGYTPSQAEADAVQKELNRKQRFNTINKYPDNYGYTLTDETGQFVLVTLNIKYAEARANHSNLSMNSNGWEQRLGDMTLNATSPVVVTPAVENYKTSRALVADAKSATGATLTLLYRVPKPEATFVLNYSISIFTKVSPLVGTEGMPRKEYEYTIGIQ